MCALFHTYRNCSIKDIDTFRLDLCATVMDCQMYAMNTLIAILCLPRSTIPLSPRANNLALIVSVSMRQACSTGNLPVHVCGVLHPSSTLVENNIHVQA